MTSDAHTDLSKAVYVLNNAQRICILTGAGISAESGIPTFRDKQTGLWENFRAEERVSTPLSEIPRWFGRGINGAVVR